MEGLIVKLKEYRDLLNKGIASNKDIEDKWMFLGICNWSNSLSMEHSIIVNKLLKRVFYEGKYICNTPSKNVYKGLYPLSGQKDRVRVLQFMIDHLELKSSNKPWYIKIFKLKWFFVV